MHGPFGWHKQSPFPGTPDLPCPKTAASKPVGQQVRLWVPETPVSPGRETQGFGALLCSGLVPQTGVCALHGMASRCPPAKFRWAPLETGRSVPHPRPFAPTSLPGTHQNPASYHLSPLEARRSFRAKVLSPFSPSLSLSSLHSLNTNCFLGLSSLFLHP